MIAIFDYGAGNLRSVANTLDAVGARYELVHDAAGIRRASKVILPGVGHFGQMMRALDQLGVREALLEVLTNGVPFLGVCLGMQALFERSEEAPDERGFGILPGAVRRFVIQERVPHMGWDELEPQRDGLLLNGLGPRPFVYFAHSYYAPVVDATAATCTYGHPYTAVVETPHIYGVQFHPEKSGPVGLQIVRNFVTSAC